MPLRPLTLGEILDGAVQTIRQNPKVMLGLSAVVNLVLSVVAVGLQYGALRSDFASLNGSASADNASANAATCSPRSSPRSCSSWARRS